MGLHEKRNVTEKRLDVADAAPVLLNGHATVTSWTPDAERLLGYTASEAVGRTAADLLLPEDAARVPELVEWCRATGAWTGLLTARHRDGHPVKLTVRIVLAAEVRGQERWLVLLEDLGRAPGWDMSRGILDRMVSQSPVGIAILDTDLRYVWSNAALSQFGGGAPHERLGKRLAEVQPGLDAEKYEAQMRQVLKTGESIIAYETVGRVRSAPRRETAYSMSFTRLEDDNGHPVGVFYTVEDSTERHRARQRLALLDQAGQHMGRSLDVTQTAQELADVSVPGLADFVSVDLLESVLRGMEPPPGPLNDHDLASLRRAGHQSTKDGVPEAVLGIGAAASYTIGSPPIRCLTSGSSWHEERLDPLAALWVTVPPPEKKATFLDLGLHSVMIVPIRVRGITLGVATFFRREHKEAFHEADLSLAEDLVARAAVCIDNARRYTRERDAALVLQRNLLPHWLPEQDAVEVAVCYRPADELTGIGGDWYDVIPLSGARVALVVGEVPGHGIDAAASMGQLRTAVRTLADLDLSPEEVLAHLDDLVAQAARDENTEPGAPAAGGRGTVGACCLYAVYDPVTGQCVMATAGHPVPALVGVSGSVTFAELPVGPALGVGGPPFEAVGLDLPEGTTIALHTDGLLKSEGTGGNRATDLETARERLRRHLERADPSLQHWCRAVVDELVPARQPDDAALLMARTRRLGTEQVATWDMPTDPAIVAEARRRSTRQLAAWGLDELAFTTELVVSELVTNAIRHAVGPIRLRLILERSLICEVFDGGASAPHLRHPKTTDEGGRGLLLISQFTQRWGTRYLQAGKVIWAEQTFTEPAV
ncbi:SpoIIE family protein phosphatase [Streptomyces laculatispora]|uniref:SpoIIE family protein phosphatase n=1 Tax=Streptomyces laculatispora TaxID=887464 RepID=UPI001A944ED6|nr:SpoIIE family protein phosphatase [Streptomyces laculatispora]MBO0913670.1 SpoIIE family protein phosphatase [Streptomyces laculatispora]